MGLGQRLQAAANALLGRVVESATVVDDDDDQFRSLTGSKRNLDAIRQSRMIEIAHFLYLSNPVAKRITEDLKDWVIGEGVFIRHKHEELQAVLDAHWEDPINDWELTQHDYVRDLGLFGELALPAFVNDIDGTVKIGILDWSAIHSVTANPENIRDLWLVNKRRPDSSQGEPLPIIRVDSEPESETFGRLMGEIFYFPVNRISTATRGVPDLLTLADFLDAYKKFLFDDMERTVLAKRILWDLEAKGSNKKALQEKAKMLKSLPAGAVYAHNDQEKLMAAVPDMQHSDTSNANAMYLENILGGAGWSKKIFISEGEGSGDRADIGQAVLKRVKGRQLFVAGMFRNIGKFVLDQWWLKNPEKRQGVDSMLTFADPLEVNKVLHDFEVVMPEPTDLDLARVSDSILKVVQAVVIGTTGNLMTEDEGRMAVASVFQNLGVDIDPSESRAEDPSQGGQEEAEAIAAAAEASRKNGKPRGRKVVRVS